METNQKPIDPTHFRYLRTAEIKDPFSFIKEFCTWETELDYLKNDISNFLRTAYSFGEEFYSGTGKSYGYDQIQLIKVMEVMYTLHLGNIDLKPGKLRNYINKYTILNYEEKNDVRKFLDSFFTFRELDDWRSILDDLLIHAYKEGDEESFSYIQEPFRTMEYLEKLAEAIFLVYEIQHLKESYPKVSAE